MRLTLPDEERALVVVVTRQVDGAANLPAVLLQGAHQGGDEIPGSIN